MNGLLGVLTEAKSHRIDEDGLRLRSVVLMILLMVLTKYFPDLGPLL